MSPWEMVPEDWESAAPFVLLGASVVLLAFLKVAYDASLRAIRSRRPQVVRSQVSFTTPGGVVSSHPILPDAVGVQAAFDLRLYGRDERTIVAILRGSGGQGAGLTLFPVSIVAVSSRGQSRVLNICFDVAPEQFERSFRGTVELLVDSKKIHVQILSSLSWEEYLRTVKCREVAFLASSRSAPSFRGTHFLEGTVSSVVPAFTLESAHGLSSLRSLLALGVVEVEVLSSPIGSGDDLRMRMRLPDPAMDERGRIILPAIHTEGHSAGTWAVQLAFGGQLAGPAQFRIISQSELEKSVKLLSGWVETVRLGGPDGPTVLVPVVKLTLDHPVEGGKVLLHVQVTHGASGEAADLGAVELPVSSHSAPCILATSAIAVRSGVDRCRFRFRFLIEGREIGALVPIPDIPSVPLTSQGTLSPTSLEPWNAEREQLLNTLLEQLGVGS